MVADGARDWHLGRYRDYLTMLARAQLGPRLRQQIDADDVVQEALLRAHEQLGTFAGTSEREFAAWLRQVLSGALVDALRAGREGEDRRPPDEVIGHSSGAIEGWLRTATTDPREQEARHEKALRLAAALARLPDEQRTAVELRQLQGLTVPQLEKVMGRSAAAVAGLLRRGLEALRRELDTEDSRP